MFESQGSMSQKSPKKEKLLTLPEKPEGERGKIKKSQGMPARKISEIWMKLGSLFLKKIP